MLAQEPEVEKKPVRIRSITLHEEGEPDRSIEIENAGQSGVPRDMATRSTIVVSDLTGNWTITGDSRSAAVQIKDRQLLIKTGSDGSLIAAFVSETRCPSGSGQRANYLKGRLRGSSLSGTLDLCPSEGFITRCGDDKVYTTGFQAEVRDTNTIAGRYRTEGARFVTGGCVKDSNFDQEHTFVLKRQDVGAQSATLKKDLPIRCVPASLALKHGVSGDEDTPSSGYTYHPADLNAYCLAQHGEGAEALLLGNKDAYSWSCIGGSPTALHSISVDDVCKFQNPWSEGAVLGDRCDPYSWSCNVHESTPVLVRLKKISVSGGLDIFDQQDLDLTYTAIVSHLSHKCGPPSPYVGVCESWKHTVTWSGSFEGQIEFELDLARVFHVHKDTNAFDLTRGSVLWIWLEGTEKDWVFDDACGIGYREYPDRFREENNWGIPGGTGWQDYFVECEGGGTFKRLRSILYFEILNGERNDSLPIPDE